MAALSRSPGVQVRAAAPGEGAVLAGLWRELWDAHESWGGYRGSREARVYGELAARLDEDARVRGGHPLLGRHVHLVAELGGSVCGQVEGWIDRLGVDPATPHTCEVRSLVVGARARRRGVGRALLDGLAREALVASSGEPCVLAAEVLDANPAVRFYADLGYVPAAWSTCIDVARGAAVTSAVFSARLAARRDAHAVAALEGNLAVRRQAANDPRHDRPRSVDATTLAVLAAQLENGGAATQREPSLIVAVDPGGTVRGMTSFATHALEPPFTPGVRALSGRFAVSDTAACGPAIAALVILACRLAHVQGATRLELTDLSRPDTDLYRAALAAGAVPWSRVVTRAAGD
jgi:GNAT superfamily N-acetyltransferase